MAYGLHVANNLFEDRLRHNISSALIGLYCFTGCDSRSSFKGKIKAFKLMQNNISYITTFQKVIL